MPASNRVLERFSRNEYLEKCKIDLDRLRCPKCGAHGRSNFALSPGGVITCINQVWYKDLKMMNQCRQIVYRPNTKDLFGVGFEDFK